MEFARDTLYVSDLDGTLLGAQPRPVRAEKRGNLAFDRVLCYHERGIFA